MLRVSILGQKRLLTVPVKLSETEKKVFAKVAKLEDRPLGYTIREMALRGLIEYHKDNNIRVNQDLLLTAIEELLDPVDGKELATRSKNKLPVMNSGEKQHKKVA